MIHRPLLRRHHRGFTVLEMMTVVFLIILLVSIAVAAYSKIVNSMSAKATVVALATAQSMLAEYEQSVPLASMGYQGIDADPYFPYLGGNNVAFADLSTAHSKDRPIPGVGSTITTGIVGQSGANRGPLPPGTTTDTNTFPPSYPPAGAGPQNAVYNTACVMMYLARVPAVNQVIANLPSKNFLSIGVKGIETAQPMSLKPPGLDRPVPTPILLDGWGNPIIFVPAGGLVTTLNVGAIDSTSKKPTPVVKLVRSSGIYPSGTGVYATGSPPFLAASDRPFWASAGSDGNFDAGDDNVYSFQQ